jgi:hypothetical protein
MPTAKLLGTRENKRIQSGDTKELLTTPKVARLEDPQGEHPTALLPPPAELKKLQKGNTEK